MTNSILKMSNVTQSKRGGKRIGAGRPPIHDEAMPLFSKRVPSFLLPLLNEFIESALKVKNTLEWDNWLNNWRIK